MGAFLSSSQLSAGLTSNGVPTASYAYSAANTVSFGGAITYSPYFPATGIYGRVTPYLVNPDPASPTISCSPFSAYSSSQQLKCPVAATLLAPGLYTISLSQIQSTTQYDPSLAVYYTYALGSTEMSIPGEATFSIAATTTVTATSTIQSGTSEILPTTTSIVPSHSTTVTAYYTTVISTVVSSKLVKAIKTTVTAACPPPKCNHNNCYRGILANSDEASDYCANFDVATAAAPFPNFVSKCEKKAASIASACSCVFPTRSVRELDARGGGYTPVFEAPDFTLSNGMLVTVVKTTALTTIPSTTITDPAPTITSGISTSTIYESLVTITTIISNIAAETTTIIKPAKNC